MKKVLVLDTWSKDRKENELLKAKLDLAIEQLDRIYRSNENEIINAFDSFNENRLIAYNTLRQLRKDQWEINEVKYNDILT